MNLDVMLSGAEAMKGGIKQPPNSPGKTEPAESDTWVIAPAEDEAAGGDRDGGNSEGDSDGEGRCKSKGLSLDTVRFKAL
jgi:hypothetical protein